MVSVSLAEPLSVPCHAAEEKLMSGSIGKMDMGKESAACPVTKKGLLRLTK
jgi:hypothetical protein